MFARRIHSAPTKGAFLMPLSGPDPDMGNTEERDESPSILSHANISSRGQGDENYHRAQDRDRSDHDDHTLSGLLASKGRLGGHFSNTAYGTRDPNSCLSYSIHA
jgi:hypothetical protein